MNALILWGLFTIIIGIFWATFSMHNRIRLNVCENVTTDFNRLRRKKNDVEEQEICNFFWSVEKEKKIRGRKNLLALVIGIQLILALARTLVEEPASPEPLYEYIKLLFNVLAIVNVMSALLIAGLTAWDKDLDLFSGSWS
uniref:Uncharacterized protein n=1 Tax=Candidatus Kentrum sp. FW TaxID=2126338 RepID=A0A450TAB4_9GAMM|nr:MAG: hypothetical protein BECKFW1821C_GA0114237_100451 [Candidatus Kentron sp. FW]